MSDPSDTDDVLHRFVSEHQAEQLLAGASDADAPSDLEAVASLLGLMREPAQPDELASTEALLARMADAVSVSASSATANPRRKPMLARLITTKVGAFAAATLVSAGAAAAATGNLPDPVQRGVASTVSHVGIDLPNPRDRSSVALLDGDPATATSTTIAATETTDSTIVTSTTTETSTTMASTTVPETTTAPTTTDETEGETEGEAERTEAEQGPVGPDATGPAAHGLCTAYAAGGDHGKRLDSVAMQNLADAATEAGQSVEEYCETVLSADDETRDDDGDESDVNDDSTVPSSSTPGSNPSDTAPGHSDDHGRPSDPGQQGSNGNGNGGGNGKGGSSAD